MYTNRPWISLIIIFEIVLLEQFQTYQEWRARVPESWYSFCAAPTSAEVEKHELKKYGNFRKRSVFSGGRLYWREEVTLKPATMKRKSNSSFFPRKLNLLASFLGPMFPVYDQVDLSRFWQP